MTILNDAELTVTYAVREFCYFQKESPHFSLRKLISELKKLQMELERLQWDESHWRKHKQKKAQ